MGLYITGICIISATAGMIVGIAIAIAYHNRDGDYWNLVLSYPLVVILSVFDAHLISQLPEPSLAITLAVGTSLVVTLTTLLLGIYTLQTVGYTDVPIPAPLPTSAPIRHNVVREATPQLSFSSPLEDTPFSRSLRSLQTPGSDTSLSQSLRSLQSSGEVQFLEQTTQGNPSPVDTAPNPPAAPIDRVGVGRDVTATPAAKPKATQKRPYQRGNGIREL